MNYAKYARRRELSLSSAGQRDGANARPASSGRGAPALDFATWHARLAGHADGGRHPDLTVEPAVAEAERIVRLHQARSLTDTTTTSR